MVDPIILPSLSLAAIFIAVTIWLQKTAPSLVCRLLSHEYVQRVFDTLRLPRNDAQIIASAADAATTMGLIACYLQLLHVRHIGGDYIWLFAHILVVAVFFQLTASNDGLGNATNGLRRLMLNRGSLLSTAITWSMQAVGGSLSVIICRLCLILLGESAPLLMDARLSNVWLACLLEMVAGAVETAMILGKEHPRILRLTRNRNYIVSGVALARAAALTLFTYFGAYGNPWTAIFVFTRSSSTPHWLYAFIHYICPFIGVALVIYLQSNITNISFDRRGQNGSSSLQVAINLPPPPIGLLTEEYPVNYKLDINSKSASTGYLKRGYSALASRIRPRFNSADETLLHRTTWSSALRCCSPTRVNPSFDTEYITTEQFK